MTRRTIDAGGAAERVDRARARPRAGYVASVDGSNIVDWAAANDASVEQRWGIGDFVLTGNVVAVARFDGGRELDTTAVGDAFMLDEERVLDGDIAFPVRQLADTALKGLSPGINDPSTAGNAMDSVADTLVRVTRTVGHRIRSDAMSGA